MKWTKVLERHQLLKLCREDLQNPNRPIVSKAIQLVKKLPTKKSPGSSDFTGKFYQTFKEKLIPVLHKFFQKVE